MSLLRIFLKRPSRVSMRAALSTGDSPRRYFAFTSSEDEPKEVIEAVMRVEHRDPRHLSSSFHCSINVKPIKKERSHSNSKPPVILETNLKEESPILDETEAGETVLNLANSLMCGTDLDKIDFCTCIKSATCVKETPVAKENNESYNIVMEPVSPKADLEPNETIKSRRYSHKNAAKRKHFRFCGHGRLWTLLALGCTWLGSICSYLSWRSTRFVGLEKSLEVTPVFKPIDTMGLIQIEICYEKSMCSMSGCEIIRLSPEQIGDELFNLSRSVLTIGTTLGIAITAVLTTSVWWETINLRPVGLGFMIAYFFQSFSMLIFNTNLCDKYKCKMASGGTLCIVASVCWIAACLAVAKMDSFKIRAIRARRNARRKARKQRKQNKRKAKFAEKRSATVSTVTDDSSSVEVNAEAFDIEQGTIDFFTAVVVTEKETMEA